VPKSKPSKSAPPANPAIEVGPRGAVIVVVALGLVAAGAWFALRGPSVPAPGPAAPPAPTAGAAAAGTYRGQVVGTTAEGDPTWGPANAPVTMVVYSDYQCPNCRQFALEVMPWLGARWMPTGLVKVVFRDFVVRGPESQQAAEAAVCAGEQGQFWPYHDLLFQAQQGENSGAFAPDRLAALATAVGLDRATFEACVVSGRARTRVDAATAQARQQAFEGTPAYVINGRTTSGAIPVERWEELFKLYAAQYGVAVPAGPAGVGGQG
jgi:protein-disulfide isomerase